MFKTLVIVPALAAAMALSAPAFADTSQEAANSQQAESQATIDVTAGTAVAEPVETRPLTTSLFYLRLGGGILPVPNPATGPTLGLGYRFELDRIGIDASMNLAIIDLMHDATRGYIVTPVRLLTQYYFTPTASSSPYLGGGLSLGLRSVQLGDARYSGSGLQGEIVGGYEFLRNSPLRMFVQAGATLPFYMTEREGPAMRAGADSPAHRYVPGMGLSFGIGWGRSSRTRAGTR